MHLLVIIFAMFQASWVCENSHVMHYLGTGRSPRCVGFPSHSAWISCKIKYVLYLIMLTTGEDFFFRWFLFSKFCYYLHLEIFLFSTNMRNIEKHYTPTFSCGSKMQVFFRDLYFIWDWEAIPHSHTSKVMRNVFFLCKSIWLSWTYRLLGSQIMENHIVTKDLLCYECEKKGFSIYTWF